MTRFSIRTLSVPALVLALSCTSSPVTSTTPAETAAASVNSPTDRALYAFWEKYGGLFAAKRFKEAEQVADEAWSRGWQQSDVAYAAACAAARDGKIDDAFRWLERASAAGVVDSGWMSEDADLAAVREDPGYAALHASIEAAHQRHVTVMNVGGGFPKSTPQAEGINADALRALRERAEATHSSAVVLLRHGKLVGEWYFGGPSHTTEMMSATEAVTGLAIGLLIDEGKIRSVDEPIATFLPEWKDGVHESITLRHVLGHTSGLHTDRTTQKKIYASRDFVRFALESRVDAPPDSEFFPNGNAVNLIAGVVRRASGLPLDRYLREKLFTPLGIREVAWTHDGAGNPHGMAGLQMHAADFAKIGQLMLQGGMWKGRRILSEAWIDESTRQPAQQFNPVSGRLWWLEAPNVTTVIDQPFLNALQARGADPAFIVRLIPLRDRPMPRLELFELLKRELGPDVREQWINQVGHHRLSLRTVVNGAYDGFSARDPFGQILVVYPSRDLVAVRFSRPLDLSDSARDFADFTSRVRALADPSGQ